MKLMQLIYSNSGKEQGRKLVEFMFSNTEKIKRLTQIIFSLKKENEKLKNEVKNFELYKFHIAQIRHVENMYRGGFLDRFEFLLKKDEAVITPNNPTHRQFLKEIERIMIELGCIHTRNRGRWFSLVTLGEAIRRLEEYQQKSRDDKSVQEYP